jgi:hypothetical protein
LAESRATEKVLFLFGAYQIGKERVFMQVAREFNMPVGHLQSLACVHVHSLC